MALKPKVNIDTKYLKVEVSANGEVLTLSYEGESSQKVYVFPVAHLQGAVVTNTKEETCVSVYVLMGNEVFEYEFEVSGITAKELNEILEALTGLL